MKNNIHIGKLIQEEVFKMNISLHDLSNILHTNEKNLLRNFERKVLSTKDLYIWSLITKIDFFKVYSDYLKSSDPEIQKKMRIHTLKQKYNRSFSHEN